MEFKGSFAGVFATGCGGSFSDVSQVLLRAVLQADLEVIS